MDLLLAKPNFSLSWQKKRKGNVIFSNIPEFPLHKICKLFTMFVKEEESACSMLHVKAAYWKR